VKLLFVGFVSTISLIIISTALLCLRIFSDSKENKTTVDFLNSKDGVNFIWFYCWSEFGGASISCTIKFV
jgi:hypothetical protein